MSDTSSVKSSVSAATSRRSGLRGFEILRLYVRTRSVASASFAPPTLSISFACCAVCTTTYFEVRRATCTKHTVSLESTYPYVFCLNFDRCIGAYRTSSMTPRMVLVMVTLNSTERDGRVGARGASAVGRLVGVVSIFKKKIKVEKRS